MKPRVFFTIFVLLAATSLLALLKWPARADTGVQPATTQSGPQLVLVGQVDVGGPAYAVAVQAGDPPGHTYAYVGAGNRLVVVDVSDPTAPQVVGQTTPFSDWVGDIFVTDTYAYLAAYTAGLRVVDITNPAAPQEVGSLVYADYVQDIYVVGSYAYLLVGAYDLRVIDISDPTAPQEVGAYHFTTRDLRLSDIFVMGKYAYVIASSDTELRVFDVSDPSKPVAASYRILGSRGNSIIYVRGDYAYLIDTGGCIPGYCGSGLSAIEISQPTSPQWSWGLGVHGRGQGVYVTDDYIYGTTTDPPGYVGPPIYTGHLYIVDGSDPTTPQEVGHYQQTGRLGDVYVQGEYIFLAAEENKLKVLHFFCAGTATLQAAAACWRHSPDGLSCASTYDRDGDGTISMVDLVAMSRWWSPMCH